MLPIKVQTYQGSLENFKMLLDSYISQYPDQPATEDLKPQAEDIYDKQSNLLINWKRTTQFVDPMDKIEMTFNAEEAQPCY